MRPGTAFLLLALATLLWAGYQITFTNDAETREWEWHQPLIAFQLEDTGEIHLQRNREKAIVRPIDKVWHLIEPVHDRLDLAAAQSIYFGLNGLQVYDHISEEEMAEEGWDDERFGLGDNAVRVRIFNPDGDLLQELAIGDITPWMKEDVPTMYVQRGPPGTGGDIFVVGGNLRALLDRPFEQLRAREALFLPRPPLAISISRGEATLEMQRQNESSQWHLTRPLDTRASEDAIKQLLETLAHSETNQFSEPSANFPSNDDAIHVNVSLSPGDGHEAESIKLVFDTHIDPESGRVRVRCSDRDYDLHLPADILDALALEPNRYRSRKLAILDPDEIQEIIIQGRDHNAYVLENLDDEWLVLLRNRFVPAEPSRVLSAIERFNNSTILNFADDSMANAEEFGLDQPLRTIVFSFKGGDQKRIDIGRSGDHVYANFHGTPFVYQVPPALLSILPETPTPWRNLLVLNFSGFDLRQFAVKPADGKETVLRQNVELGLWVGTHGGEDASMRIDLASVSDAIAKLERLRVERWLSSPARALTSLANPDWTVHLLIKSTNPDGSIASRDDLTLEFSAVSPQSPFYFGRINKGADVFLIKRESVASFTGDFFHPDSAD